MKQHLTKKAAEWFNDPDSWKSFLELIPLVPDIEEHWFNEATGSLRKHFSDKPCPGWSFLAWDGLARDTWWFLEEFGRDAVGIGYGWRYHLCFGVASGNKVDRSALVEALKQDVYKPLVEAFGRTDPPEFGFPLEQYGNFSFGMENDGNVIGAELAWCAGHRTEEFVEQAASKIEAFTLDPKSTELLRKLNRELLHMPQQQ
ncbi:MAG: hypothetical protein ABJQ29_15635 [Luteolibacter sp.]